MSQFLLKLGLLLPLLVGMVWVNWSIDPAVLLVEHQDDPARHPYENLIASDLLAHRPHRLKSIYLESVVDELIFRSRPQIDTLVFGNSIAKPIHAGLFGGSNFFNASITGGRIEEMIIAYQIALDSGLHPRHVLIEIDGRSLGSRAALPDSKTLRRALNRLGVPMETKRDPIFLTLRRMADPVAKLIYRHRAASIECVNAQARNRGLQRFPVRGPAKAKVIGLWHALAHNLMRMFRLSPSLAR